MNRRMFLRGLGGACVAAPFLGSLEPRTSRAQAAAPPKRLIVMFTPHGCLTTRFFPEKSHGVLTAEDLAPTTLQPLAPYVKKLLMPRGIRAMNEWTADMRRGQGNDIHVQVTGSFFTCQPVAPNSDEPLSIAPGRFDAKPIGPSLDHVIAKQLSPDGVPLVVQLAESFSAKTAISFSASETLHVGVSKISELYARLTGLPTLSPDGYLVRRGMSIIDVVRDDLDTLERFDISRADRRKLDAWKELLHEATKGIEKRCTMENAALLGLTEETARDPSVSTDGDVLTDNVTDTLDGADLYSNLVVLAALCNVNPVIFIKYPAAFVYSGLGINLDNDLVNHRMNSATLRGACVPGILELAHKLDDYYARKFAHLVAQLDAFEEGDGTLLDNCAAVWFRENSDGLARNLNNLPIVQAGSLGGYFKTGWAVNVEDGSPDLTRGNSEYYPCVEADEEVDAIAQLTGTDPRLANAPINKYYCNLMNALGVKADEDGFPAPGGTREVIHFGRYDKTEDFIGGGVNPPKIHDPGEFTALRAAP